jgi:hypothetical protein
MSNIFDEEPELSEDDYLEGQEAFLIKENMKKLISDMVMKSNRPKNDFQKRMLFDFVSENILCRPEYKGVQSYHILDEIERCLREL